MTAGNLSRPKVGSAKLDTDVPPGFGGQQPFEWLGRKRIRIT